MTGLNSNGRCERKETRIEQNSAEVQESTLKENVEKKNPTKRQTHNWLLESLIQKLLQHEVSASHADSTVARLSILRR